MNIFSIPNGCAIVTLFITLTLLPTTYLHAEEPTTKCVTAATTASHTNALNRLEKDIAAHLADPKNNIAIQAYRNAIATAWSAIQEPYCGYGKDGAKSSIKSFGKSIERARLAFLQSIKNQAPLKPPPPIAAVPSVANTSTSATQPTTPKTLRRSNIQSGLRRGMRRTTVAELQKVLAIYFNLPEKDLVTGYFGPKTEELIITFQLEKKIISSKNAAGAGLVGPKTSAILNQL